MIYNNLISCVLLTENVQSDVEENQIFSIPMKLHERVIKDLTAAKNFILTFRVITPHSLVY
jgi:hypothetical protein